MRGFYGILFFSTSVLVSVTVVSAVDSKLQSLDLGYNNVSLSEQSLVRRASEQNRSRKDASPQRTDQVAGGDKVHVRCKIDLSMGPTSHAHTVPHERRIRH